VPAPPPAPRPSGESFAARLKRLRVERGLSQRQLADVGISYAYVSRLEAADRHPSMQAIRLLARRLGVTPEYLETGLDMAPREALELRLSDAELRLRLGSGADEGREILREVLGEAEALAEDDLVLRARIALGLAAFHDGRHVEAVEYLGAAVESPMATPGSQPSAYLALATAELFLGRPIAAIDLLEWALERLDDEPSDPSIRIRFATYLSGALGQLGEFQRAREVLRSAADEGITTAAAADRLAERRVAAIGRAGHIRTFTLGRAR